MGIWSLIQCVPQSLSSLMLLLSLDRGLAPEPAQED
jgi:hypothetical protein